MEYLDLIIKGILGVLAAGFGALIIACFKWLFTINKNVEGMVNNGKKRACENQVQFQMLRGQGQAIKATLEVVSKVQNNGNVTAALKAMDENEKVYNSYIDSLVEFKEPIRASR